ncbi:hypothetical protein [Gordonia tangerina]|uniref:Replication protein n=1 Tax=Gordonia tangerina TaxID=2911060 RepID=A0ABS9DD92_9ACTN|nr:hypothetical protein [Gordonia tangerina]MCF3937189.1 hypothetical protein [Gordonia tangerina]
MVSDTLTDSVMRYVGTVTGILPNVDNLNDIIGRRRGSTRRALESAAGMVNHRTNPRPKIDIDPYGRRALITGSGALNACDSQSPLCPRCAHRVTEVAWDSAMIHLDAEANPWTGKVQGKLWLITALTRDDCGLREQFEVIKRYLEALRGDTKGAGIRLLLGVREVNARITWESFHPHVHAVIWTASETAPDLRNLRMALRRHHGSELTVSHLDMRGGAVTPENANELIRYCLKEFQPIASDRTIDSIATKGAGLPGLLRLSELPGGLGVTARGMVDRLMLAQYGRAREGHLPASSLMTAQRRPTKSPGSSHFRGIKFQDWDAYDRSHPAQVKQGVRDAVDWAGYWMLPEGTDPRAIPSDEELTDRSRWAEEMGDPAAEAHALGNRWDTLMAQEREDQADNHPTPEMIADQAREAAEWGDGADAERWAWEAFWAAEAEGNNSTSTPEREGREWRGESIPLDTKGFRDRTRGIRRRTRRVSITTRLNVNRRESRDRAPPRFCAGVVTRARPHEVRTPRRIFVRVDVFHPILRAGPPPSGEH